MRQIPGQKKKKKRAKTVNLMLPVTLQGLVEEAKGKRVDMSGKKERPMGGSNPRHSDFPLG